MSGSSSADRDLGLATGPAASPEPSRPGIVIGLSTNEVPVAALDQTHATDGRARQGAAQILDSGALLGRLYRVLHLIGQGAQGEVYEVEHIHMGTRFAAKVLNREYANDPELLSRFQREARTASQIDHPNIARVVNFDTSDDGRSFVIMELLVGESLEKRIERGPMPVNEVCAIAADVASALHAAHARGAVHRDVKPANVFLAETAVGRVTKVMDFGIAKIARGSDDAKLTRAGVLVGTPAYMAPEQVTGEISVDHRADVYALGGMMFEMLAGRPPFVAGGVLEVLMQHVRDPVPSIASFRGDVPLKLEAIVRQCMAKDPVSRFQSMEELARELQSVPSGLPRLRPNSVPRPAVAPETQAPPPPHHGVSNVKSMKDKLASYEPPVVSASARGGSSARLGHSSPEPGLKLPDTEAKRHAEAQRNLRLAGVVMGVLLVGSIVAKIVKPGDRPLPVERISISATISSEPMGAEIYLRGEKVGATPLVFPLRVGKSPIVFELRATGYKPKIVSILPDADRIEKVILEPLEASPAAQRPSPATPAKAPLDAPVSSPPPPKPKFGFLTISTDSVVDVRVDGRSEGRTPLDRLALDPGSHKVVLYGRRGETRTLDVNIELNAESTYKLNLGWEKSLEWDLRRKKGYSR